MKIFNLFSRKTLDRKKMNLKTNEMEALEITNTSLLTSREIAEGKSFPLLFIDTSKREDIKDFIRNHQCISTGDVETTFCEYKKDKYNLLILFQFKAPEKCNFFITFNLINDGFILDLIIKNQGCYIQSNFYGERCSESMDAPKILVEIPNYSVIEKWKNTYRISIIEKFRRDGFKGQKAIKGAEEYIKRLDFLNFRMK